MGAVYNAIVPGYPWSQMFRFTSDPLGVGEIMRADFRRNPASPELLSIDETSVGIVRNGNDFTVNLTDIQTALFEGFGRINFDFYGVQGVAVRHLQLRVRVPVKQGL